MDKLGKSVTIDDVIKQNKQLSHCCKVQEKEIERLNKELAHHSKEEEKRILRQAEVFQEFKKRSARVHKALDVKLLDVIDSYETQLSELRIKLQHCTRCENDCDEVKEIEPHHDYTSVVQSYKNELLKKENQMRNLEEKLRVTELDLVTRPTMKDLRQSQRYVQEMEKALTRNDTGALGDRRDAKGSNHVMYSRHIDDLCRLPASICHEYLEDVAKELKVQNLDRMVHVIQEQKLLVEEMSAYYELAKEVTEMAEEDGKGKLSPDDVLSLVREWHEAAESVGVDPATRVNVLDHAEMSRVIEHIQKLFDVPDMAGLYAAMNRVYSRFGEMTNVQHTLRDSLGLASDATCHMIVDAVDILKLSNDNHLRSLLHTDDLSSVLQKLEEHAAFMPTFKTLIDRLMDLLGVTSIDDILPAVRILVHVPPQT